MQMKEESPRTVRIGRLSWAGAESGRDEVGSIYAMSNKPVRVQAEALAPAPLPNPYSVNSCVSLYECACTCGCVLLYSKYSSERERL